MANIRDPRGINPDWINVVFQDVDTDDVVSPFDATSGGWIVTAGDIAFYEYAIIGELVLIIFDFRNTTTTSLPATLLLNLPDEIAMARLGWCGMGQFSSAGDSSSIFLTATTSTRLVIERVGLGDFPTVSNGVDVGGMAIGKLLFTA